MKSLRKDLAEEITNNKIAQANVTVTKVNFFSVKKSLDKCLEKIDILEKEKRCMGNENKKMSRKLGKVTGINENKDIS